MNQESVDVWTEFSSNFYSFIRPVKIFNTVRSFIAAFTKPHNYLELAEFHARCING